MAKVRAKDSESGIGGSVGSSREAGRNSTSSRRCSGLESRDLARDCLPSCVSHGKQDLSNRCENLPLVARFRCYSQVIRRTLKYFDCPRAFS